MSRPGPTNSIVDVPGLTVGHAGDDRLKSGVTVVVADEPAVASAHVMGGAPGTRDLDLLAPDQTVETVDAIVLSGGSAYGLDAASGVQARLREMGRGFRVGPVTVPIVPGAILFDLLNGGDKDWGRYPPYRELAYAATVNASADGFAPGTLGAGTGATTATLKGGLGTASARLSFGATVGVVVAVNPVGTVTVGEGPHFWAAPHEIDGEFGGLGLPSPLPDLAAPRLKGTAPAPAANTTIAIVATDARLTKAQAKRLAVMAHDGFARAIYPSHTPIDGDLVFALSTDRVALPDPASAMIELGIVAANVLARAIARAVHRATPADGDLLPTWAARFGG